MQQVDRLFGMVGNQKKEKKNINIFQWSLFVTTILFMALGFLVNNEKLSKLPIIKFLDYYQFGQRWTMFSPPPQTQHFLYYSYFNQAQSSWSDLIPLGEENLKKLHGSLFSPPGIVRMALFHRVLNADFHDITISHRNGYYISIAELKCNKNQSNRIRFYLYSKNLKLESEKIENIQLISEVKCTSS